MMTKQEAIEILTCGIAEVEWSYPMEYATALDMAIEALEQEPKRGEWIVHPLMDEGRVELECPICGDTFIRAVDYKPHFCENCGGEDGGGRMKTIHCPKDIGLVNTFDSEDCKREQFYNDCYHCWTSAIADCENKSRPTGKWIETDADDFISRNRVLMYIADVQLTVSDPNLPTILPSDLCEWISDGIKDMKPVAKCGVKMESDAE